MKGSVGFLHKPQPGKAGLLYRFIEEFRAAVADGTVFGMLKLPAEVDEQVRNEGAGRPG